MKEVINYLTYRIKTEKFLFCGWCLYSYIWLNIFKNFSEMGAVVGAFTGLLSYERKNNIISMEKILPISNKSRKIALGVYVFLVLIMGYGFEKIDSNNLKRKLLKKVKK